MASTEFGANPWTIPNAISAARLLLVPVFAVLIFTHRFVPALVVLAVAGISDWVDGYLARRLNQFSRLGQMLDPAADRLFIFVTLIGLVFHSIIPWWLLVVIAARDLMMMVVTLVLARHGYGPLEVNFVGKGGTFALMYAFPLLLLGSLHNALGTVASILGWAFAIWGVVLYWLAGVLYVHQAARLLKDHHD
ncbi:MAG: CDP-alcohol phosphatidyltransferase family protein [Cellulomonadaceae bacterium]|jgi:cardiolipin synthase|nr:CDP-alcohol phosphatidyltransferase family protein [Cellulomonadaceae bacterium]